MLQAEADSVVALASTDELVWSDGMATLAHPRTLRLCTDQPFSDQFLLGGCTGVLVAPDLVLTAAHCLIETTTVAIFGFRMAETGAAPSSFPARDVYPVQGVLPIQTPMDLRLVKLRRTVPDHRIAVLARGQQAGLGTPVHMIGDPWGLPQKFAGGGTVLKQELNIAGDNFGRFWTDLAVVRGDSGAPLFDSDTKLVQGIVTLRSFPESTYDSDARCIRPLFCAKGVACTGAYYVRDVVSFVPAVASTFFVNVDEPGAQHRTDALTLDQDGVHVAVSTGADFERLVRISNSVPWGLHGNYFADLTGDGLADAIAVDRVVSVCVAGAGKFGEPEIWSGMGEDDLGNRGTYFADVDGDGRADAIRVDEADVKTGSTVSIRVARALGSANAGGFAAWTLWLRSSDDAGSRYGFKFVDVDADGKADAVRFADTGVIVATSDGAHFLPWRIWWNDAYRGPWFTGLADVNGDGAADLISVDDTTVQVRRAERSVGDRPDHFATATTWLDTAFRGAAGLGFADVDGDGAADALAVDLDGIRVRLSTRSGFGRERVWLDRPFYSAVGIMDEALP